MVQTQALSNKRELHVVTGGGGYAGFALGKKLVEKGHRVRLLDVREPVWDLVDGMEFKEASVCEKDGLMEELQGASAVYHLASYGMSGREQLNTRLIEKVNIQGTETVVQACLANDVTRLVYTSTYNVVFGGTEIRDGDESLPYLEEERFTDHYSKTKMFADKKILAANGQRTAHGQTLNCCVLRLAGVYGPGEQRHIPRIMSYLEQGLVKVTYGPRDSMVDFLHVDNLVQAHVLAAEELDPSKGAVAAGKAYFISDDKPINNFEFFRPLFEGLGYTHPKVNLPLGLVFYFAWLTEMVHFLVSRVYNFQPILTRTEVYKTGVTHYFSVQRATRDLGYKPSVQNDLSGVVAYYRKLGRVKGHAASAWVYWLVNAVIVCVIYYLLTSCLPKVTALGPGHTFA